MSGKKIEVEDRLLLAADRLYDAVDTVLQSLDASQAQRLLALDALRFQLQRARDGYDAAISGEVPR